MKKLKSITTLFLILFISNLFAQNIEECGLEASEWTEILQMHLSNSVSDELAIIYVAKNLTQKQAEPEDTEQLQLKKLPFAEAFEMVMNGTITDSMSVAAIMKLKLMGL